MREKPCQPEKAADLRRRTGASRYFAFQEKIVGEHPTLG
jgi:hypothetical protein